MESFSTPVALSSVQTVVNALDGAMNMNGIHGSSQKQKLLGFDTGITFLRRLSESDSSKHKWRVNHLKCSAVEAEQPNVWTILQKRPPWAYQDPREGACSYVGLFLFALWSPSRKKKERLNWPPWLDNTDLLGLQPWSVPWPIKNRQTIVSTTFAQLVP